MFLIFPSAHIRIADGDLGIRAPSAGLRHAGNCRNRRRWKRWRSAAAVSDDRSCTFGGVSNLSLNLEVDKKQVLAG